MGRVQGEVARRRRAFWLWLLLGGWACQAAAGITAKYTVDEEQPVGTVIGRLSETLAGQLHPSSRRFRLMPRLNGSLLRLREEDGELSVAARLDRERLCRRAGPCRLTFDVITLPTEQLQLIQVEVEVRDVNDNPPHFPRARIPLEISESAAVGARFPLDGAADPDAGDNSLRGYSLSPEPHFALEVRLGTDGARSAELLLLRRLDRERQAAYQLRLTAWDGGRPARSGTALLLISVADSNDNSPAFERPAYSLRLPEDTAAGSLLLRLNASDPDQGSNGRVRYSFGSHPSARLLDTFELDADSGRLTLRRPLDFELSQSYEIDVQAQDLGPNSVPAHCKIVVRVLDVNDNAPEVTITPVPLGGGGAGGLAEEALSDDDDEGEEAGPVASVPEGVPPRTFVALVRVQDRDSGPNGRVSCTLRGGAPFDLQQTGPSNFVIQTNGSLDRELQARYRLQLVARDAGSPGLSTVRSLTVRLSDRNDNPPRFAPPAGGGRRRLLSVAENNPPGLFLGLMSASDPDQAENGRVTYTLLEGAVPGGRGAVTTYLTIEPSTGALYALRAFDREEVDAIAFTVQARDGGRPQLAANASVLLTVLDQNDNPPAVLQPRLRNGSAQLSLAAGSRPRQLLTTIAALDPDAGLNGEFTCSIVEGGGPFMVEPGTCDVYTNRTLAPGQHWDLLVALQDKGTPSLSTVAAFTVLLLPEEPPQPQEQSTLDDSMIIIISLGLICALLLVIMATFATRCNRDKKDTRSYNCRLAESTYQHHPKRPSRQIHKGDITLVHTSTGTLPLRSQHRASPSSSPTLSGMDRPRMCSSRQTNRSRQSLNSLVTLSSNHLPENFSLELTHTSPPVEQVSQLLSMLHQGQYQPRPNFRGNKYSRSYRYALQDMDKFSLKDSGRGDSEAGDSDYDLGRDSPIDRLLGEGFSDLFVTDSHRFHPAMKLCTDECKVLGHSDQCWMPPLSSGVSADYRSNMFIPGEDTQQLQEDDGDSSDSSEKKKSFLTFGKESQNEETEDLGTSSLLSEMNSVFQRLLPPQMDIYAECSGVGSVSSLENKKGHLAAKPAPYPQGVAAWAASTHFQNPVNSVGIPPINHINPPPISKWLPAMEEIPENYEEDEFDNVLNQLAPSKRESKHELIDASELVAEINKLLQDVRQS
ncbi:protocadherin-18a [Mustelus asterias]